MKLEDNEIMDSYALFHPLRCRIVELLAEKPMHVNEIAKALGEERRLVSYHLSTLEEYGFVSSSYEIAEHPKLKGKALRRYRMNGKMEHVVSRAQNQALSSP